ncbi:MAG TPA: RHS repeat-associated core domain-containing protein [Kiritimatiellia bacterium]|nr:RHS repeat-associated core domain-containing protein [Kiritimatiellia bacterium]HMP33876.1 RHS repeat-associated core domain-containing protein [Kiritimatiellia bacterium]
MGDDEDGCWGAYAPWTAWYTASNLTYTLTPSAGDSIRFALPGGLPNGVIDNVRITRISYADTLFVWGLDLSQSWQGAGGVGGLVAQVSGGSGTAAYYPTYDGNGNISEYLDDTGSIHAHYRYDPFGNTTTSTGAMANHFAYRFSTKPWDEVVEGYYYGYRFYNPELGKWLSRDPIGEDGGINLASFLSNDTVNSIDLLGLNKIKVDCCPKEKIDKMALEAINRSLRRGDSDRIEYCGLLCCDQSTGEVIYTGPHKGWNATGWVEDAVGNWVTQISNHCNPEKMGQTEDSPGVSSPCPKGTIQVGDYHTHPMQSVPSEDDRKWCRKRQNASQCKYRCYLGNHGQPVCQEVIP